VFGAGKVVTTLSTTKIAIAEEFLGKGTPDLIVDYTKENVVEKIGKGSVDFMLDTAGQTLSALKVVKKGGVIVSISTVPSGDQMMKQMPDLKFYLRFALNFVDWVLRSWTKWNDVDYGYMSLEGNREDLERLTGWVEEGSLRPVVGEMAGLSDIEGVRRGCGRILDGKGGVGKFVIEID
jgi:NADPH:quinone reductase-like Zn-dependent oxidoreductase